MLFGYAISGERTLEAFYEVLSPFAVPFMALFGRDQMPSRSALSRFLAALTQPVVEALRTLFLEDGLARPLCADAQEAGLLDRQGTRWIVFEIDGTREAARQRALPQTDDLPAPHRRLDEVCAPGYTGRKRGEVVRTRTTVNQAHSFQWLGSFGNRGNGRSREELRQATSAIDAYLAAQHLPRERACVAFGWAIWHRSRARRCGELLLCHARQRLRRAESARDPDPPALACGSVVLP